MSFFPLACQRRSPNPAIRGRPSCFLLAEGEVFWNAGCEPRSGAPPVVKASWMGGWLELCDGRGVWKKEGVVRSRGWAKALSRRELLTVEFHLASAVVARGDCKLRAW
ncbi:hypothetical protein NDU88_000505 [Pleurodeles waltl]|uniref:Uncharacterized protein n=1 Tax=Pleurodeles waltl TaxID=8319 RepID=A0AAV7LUX3_PLEWA|nr:hypothetical protein NDU88_000505 [Pleurodeles waltl]